MRSNLETSEEYAQVAEETALLTLRGVGLNEQVKLLKEKYPKLEITRSQVVSLKKNPKYIDVYQQKADEMVSNGQIELKTGAAELVPLVLACLKSKVQEGDVKAAIATINVLIGVDKEDGNKQAQQLQIIMPGATLPLKS